MPLNFFVNSVLERLFLETVLSVKVVNCQLLKTANVKGCWEFCGSVDGGRVNILILRICLRCMVLYCALWCENDKRSSALQVEECSEIKIRKRSIRLK